jgi:hypothetical protein
MPNSYAIAIRKILALSLVLAAATWGARARVAAADDIAAGGSTGIQGVQARTGFQENTYERVSGPVDACAGDFLDLQYAQTGDNVVLHLGDRFIFADLAHASRTDDTEPGCKLKVTNILSAGEIIQKSVNTCKDPAQAFVSVQILKQSRERLVYSLNKKTGSKVDAVANFTCVFKLAPAADLESGD